MQNLHSSVLLHCRLRYSGNSGFKIQEWLCRANFFSMFVGNQQLTLFIALDDDVVIDCGKDHLK